MKEQKRFKENDVESLAGVVYLLICLVTARE